MQCSGAANLTTIIDAFVELGECMVAQRTLLGATQAPTQSDHMDKNNSVAMQSDRTALGLARHPSSGCRLYDPSTNLRSKRQKVERLYSIDEFNCAILSDTKTVQVFVAVFYGIFTV